MMEMKITVEAPDLAASILKLAEAIASGRTRRCSSRMSRCQFPPIRPHLWRLLWPPWRLM